MEIICWSLTLSNHRGLSSSLCLLQFSRKTGATSREFTRPQLWVMNCVNLICLKARIREDDFLEDLSGVLPSQTPTAKLVSYLLALRERSASLSKLPQLLPVNVHVLASSFQHSLPLCFWRFRITCFVALSILRVASSNSEYLKRKDWLNIMSLFRSWERA